MRARTLLMALLFTATLPGVQVARAQSLADVARKEAERRKEVKEPQKTFTNDDLPNSPPSANANPAQTPATDAAAPATASDKPADDATKDGSGTKDEKYWSGRIKALRDALENDHVLVDAMQSRVNALTTDFVNRDDPAQRSLIAQNKQKALDELTRLQTAVVNDTKAIADFEEQARKAGVPPGWLR